MSAASAGLAVLPASVDDIAAAGALARRLALSLLPAGADTRRCDRVPVVLEVAGARLSLRRTGRGAPGPVAVDFGSAGMRHRRQAGHNELLGRAVGVGRKSPLRVLDATAGLGRDSFVLADLGCEVLLCEREPVMAAMLEWGLREAAASGDPWLCGVLRRMELHAGDARDVSPQRLEAIDVIYLDPMFPARDRRAGVKKEMALFQQVLERDDGQDDAAALLQWARGTAAARVVLKRPLRAGHLACQEPSHSIGGRAVRFDVYVRRALV